MTRLRRRGISLCLVLLAMVGATSHGVALQRVVRSGPTLRPAPAQLLAVDHATRVNQTTSSCKHAHGPFTVKGNEIIGGTGARFLPYGITVYGLSLKDWQSEVDSDEAQINAAANDWCVNLVRIQAAPNNMLSDPSPGLTYNSAFLKALEAEVSVAEGDGLDVVISAQTQASGGPFNPTANTLKYWEDIGQAYKGKAPDVIFDLFNEPKVLAGTADATWTLWQKGGEYKGTTYIGMQTMVTQLDADGYDRQFWIEGPYTGVTLSLVAQYPITGPDIVYDIHHPAGDHNAATWDKDFGTLSKTKPVVDGEWAQYASTVYECWPDAATSTPAFYSYLQSHDIGLVMWALQPGVLDSGTSLSDPSTIKSTYACKDGLDQGAGALTLKYFEQQNGG
jgi:hypothetical protein